MSEENVQLAREANDAFNRGDQETWHALIDPDVEMVPVRDWPENAPIRGADAVWTFFTEVVAGAWEGGSAELHEVIDAGGDRVVANLRRQAHGKASGAPFEFSYWISVVFREGRLSQIAWFVKREEALEAARRSE